MYTNNITRKPLTFFAIAALVAGSSFLSACSSDDDNVIQGNAHVMIVNAAEGSSAQDFYVDDTKVNSSAVAYTQAAGYYDVGAGSRKMDFKTSGSTTVNSTASVAVQPDKYYTVYYTGGTSTSASTATEDDRTAPSSGKAKVRFIHLASGMTSAIDFGVQNGSKLATNIAYKTASSYFEVDPTISLQLFVTGSANATTTLNSLGLQAGKVYTIYVSGSTIATLSAHTLVNM